MRLLHRVVKNMKEYGGSIKKNLKRYRGIIGFIFEKIEILFRN